MSAIATEIGTGGPALPAHLQKALGRVTEISSLPEITTRIVQVVEDPKSTAHDMHELVKNDPALATKILKVVNSAFYGLPSQIASLDRAIVMLGMSAVKNIALAASLSRFFKPDLGTEKFKARDLWQHAVAVGVTAKALAGPAGMQSQADEAFVAGLVHDMGLLIELQLFPEELKRVVERCSAEATNFCAVEQELLGADHQAFGNALAQKWKFPAGLRNAIAYHHAPLQLRPEYRKFAALVYIADTICAHNNFGFSLTAGAQEIDEQTMAAANLTEDRISPVLEELPARVAEAAAIFAEH
ncbi:MAG: HDOD domain-containing protein [Planctomycetia bacterium]|nr:MAG: HDOD domain-containing protein [Planctomycetia bacterium]